MNKSFFKYGIFIFWISFFLHKIVIAAGTSTSEQELSSVLKVANETISNARKIQAASDPFVPDNSTIFIGDSIIQRLPADAVVPGAVNYGIGWQRSDQLIESINLYGSMNRASRVIVMVGTNDLMQGREFGIEDRYKKIIDKIPSGTEVILMSPPPMGDIYFEGRQVDHSNIRMLSLSARKACLAYQRCRFVDAFEALSFDGQPIHGVLAADRVHLSSKGYGILVNILRQVLLRED